MNTLDILMIAYKRPEYLTKAIAGVLAQTYKDFRLIIYNNEKHNKNLAEITTEVFLNSYALYVGKVDSDTIVPPDWAERLLEAHKKEHFGFIGGFHFRPEDLNGIIPRIENGIWQKPYIGGCSFIIRRQDFKGYKGTGTLGLSEYQVEMGYPNGYLWNPILYVDHMEDARSSHYIGTEEYNRYKVQTKGVTLEQYQASIVRDDYMSINTL